MAKSNVSTLPASAGGTQVPSGAPPAHGPLGPMDNAEVLDAIKESVTEELSLVAQRKSINESISAVREKVKSRGINLKAYKAALSYYSMPDAHRANFDRDMAIVRKAIDMPLHPDLFEGTEAAPDAPAETAPKH